MNILQIKQRQTELLDEINAKLKGHPQVKYVNGQSCPGCEICSAIQKLGAEYEALTLQRRRLKSPIYIKAEQIIQKGEDATRSEIEFLINKAKMTKKDAAEALGIPVKVIQDVCFHWGIGRIRRERAV